MIGTSRLQLWAFFAAFVPENQVLSVDESKVYSPPDKLQLPETSVTTSDSAFSMLESDLSSSDSSSPTYSKDPPGQEEVNRSQPRGQPPVEVDLHANLSFSCVGTCTRCMTSIYYVYLHFI